MYVPYVISIWVPAMWETSPASAGYQEMLLPCRSRHICFWTHCHHIPTLCPNQERSKALPASRPMTEVVRRDGSLILACGTLVIFLKLWLNPELEVIKRLERDYIG